MSLVLGIISGKGGTGKSTVSYGLGAAFSSLNKSVLIVDLDEGLRCIDLISGIEESVTNDLSDILNGNSLDTALYNSKFYKNIFIIPAPADTGSANYVNLSEFVKSVKDKFDVVIFDFPAGIDYDKLASLGADSHFIAVCNLDPVSVKDAAAIKSKLPLTDNEPRLIINRFNVEYIKDGVYGNIDDIIDKSGLRLLGIVSGSVELMTLSLTHKLNIKGKPFKSFLRIAKRITGEEVKLPKPEKI